MEKVRVLRVIEYVGDRDWVEKQVAQSIQGEKRITRGNITIGVIKVATLGTYPEVLEKESDEVVARRNFEKLRTLNNPLLNNAVESLEHILDHLDDEGYLGEEEKRDA